MDRLTKFPVINPTDVLREYMEHYGLFAQHLAYVAGITIEIVEGLLTGAIPISQDLARVLEGVFGRPAAFWWMLQQNYDNAQRPTTPWRCSPPGDALREIMTHRCMTALDVANEIDWPVERVNLLLTGASQITASIAELLACTMAGTINFWVQRDVDYRLCLQACSTKATVR